MCVVDRQISVMKCDSRQGTRMKSDLAEKYFTDASSHDRSMTKLEMPWDSGVPGAFKSQCPTMTPYRYGSSLRPGKLPLCAVFVVEDIIFHTN